MRRLTNEEYIEKAKAVWGDEYDYSNTQFVKYRQKIMVRCRKHGEFEISPLSHVSGVGCQACRKERKGTRIKMDKDKFIERAREPHGDKFDYSLAVYVDTDTPVCIICPEHGEFWQQPYLHMKGACCKICSGKKMTFEIFTERARDLHSNKYDYSNVEWINGDTHVEIVCPIHGSFHQLPRNHITGVMGCPKCGWSKYTYEEFVEMGQEKFGDRFDYSEFVFLGLRNKGFITCKTHNTRLHICPHDHLRYGNGGCPKCYGDGVRGYCAYSTERFIELSKEKHGDRYDYSLVNYYNSRTEVKIVCPEHGVFEQQPTLHLNGHGCQKCGGNAKLTNEIFIERAEEAHGKLYDYSFVNYVNIFERVVIGCEKHGKFLQQPVVHLQGCGCPRCGCYIRSKRGDRWLDSLNLNLEEEFPITTTFGSRFVVDGFDVKNNVVYEFLGDFWHGNPKRFNLGEDNPKTKCSYRELYEKTKRRFYELCCDGYDIVYKWETPHDIHIEKYSSKLKQDTGE